MAMQKSEVIKQLHEGTIQIEFEKVSGEMRQMAATLKEDVIPSATKEDPLSQKKVRAINDEVMAVWDTTANGWRSFRWDRLKNVNGEAFVYGD
jgi:hypothetical protein